MTVVWLPHVKELDAFEGALVACVHESGHAFVLVLRDCGAISD